METWSLNNFVKLVQNPLRDNWTAKSVFSTILKRLSQICGETYNKVKTVPQMSLVSKVLHS